MFLEHFVRSAGEILFQPPDGRIAVLEIAGHGPLATVQVERSDAVVVMADRAVELLAEGCGIDSTKVRAQRPR